MNLFYLVKSLLRRKWLIIIPTMVALIAAVVFTRFEHRYFSATSELSTGFTTPDPFENVNLNQYTSQVKFNNVIQTLVSPRIIFHVSYKLLLHDLEETPFNTAVDKQMVQQLLKKVSPTRVNEVIRARLDSFYILNTTVKEDRRLQDVLRVYGYDPQSVLQSLSIVRIPATDFIQITCKTKDPLLSAFIANSVSNGFLKYYREVQSELSNTSIDTLSRILQQKKQILDSKLHLLQVSGGGVNATTNVDLLRTFETQLSQEKNELIGSQIALDNVNKQIQSYTKNDGTTTNEEIISLRNRMDNLQAQAVNGGSSDPNLTAEINRLRTELLNKVSAAGSTGRVGTMSDLLKQQSDLQVKVAVSSQTIDELQTKINTLKSSVQSSASKEAAIQALQNEVDLAKQEYATANNRYNDAINHDIFPGNNFKQTLIASPPLNADPSKKVLIIGLSGASVLFLSIFLILFFEFMDPSIKAPSFFKDQVQLPLLGVLEKINIKKHPVNEIFSADGKLPHVITDFRDQIKQLRYELEKGDSKIFLITSARRGAGKSMLIESLSESLSLSDKRVLIIDANFRHNTLSEKLNAAPSLIKPFLNSSRLKELVTSTSDQHIDIIGCENIDHTPDEVLPKSNLLGHLKEFAAEYDYVLIEGAALNSGPDSKELLKYVEKVVAVFSADQPLGELDQKSVSFLAGLREACLGSVLNSVDPINVSL